MRISFNDCQVRSIWLLPGGQQYLRGGFFHSLSDRINLFYVVDRQLRHEDTAVTQTDEESLLGQPLQCFAEWAPGRAQLTCQDGFIDLLARAEDSLDDLFPQVIGDQLCRGPSL